MGNKIEVVLATEREVFLIENQITQACLPFLDIMKGLTDSEFKQVIDMAMMFDVERGLLSRQKEHKKYYFSESFNLFEAKLWEAINTRLEHVGDDFFDMT